MVKKKADGQRFELIAAVEWWAVVAEAAAKAEQTTAAYVRLAVTQRMEREGLSPPPAATAAIGRPRKEPAAEEKPKRPRGRPRKEK